MIPPTEIAAEHYEHLVSASGGSNRATLTFAADGTATIESRSSWMGAGKREFRMQFRVVRRSERYGLLCLTEIERLDEPLKVDAAEINEAVCGFDDDDQERVTYWGVAYEYLRLPGGEAHIPNDPHLMDMGSTTWNERMDLILIARVAEREYAEREIDPEIVKALCALDKLKLSRQESR
jgi:hypothetical protein